MDRITLICTTLGNQPLINKMLASAKGFDQIILHLDNPSENPLIDIDFKNAGSPINTVTAIQHLGIGDAYNYMLINHVHTEWVCCFCDDDYFYEDGLSKMINEIHKGIYSDVAHYKFHISGYIPKEDIRGQYHKFFGNAEYDLCERSTITPELLKKHNRLPAGSFFRKTAWDKAGGFSGDKCHDWNLWKRMINTDCKFKYFPHTVYNMVRRDNSAWFKQNRKDLP